jgi:hypothetical protein
MIAITVRSSTSEKPFLLADAFISKTPPGAHVISSVARNLLYDASVLAFRAQASYQFLGG